MEANKILLIGALAFGGYLVYQNLNSEEETSISGGGIGKSFLIGDNNKSYQAPTDSSSTANKTSAGDIISKKQVAVGYYNNGKIEYDYSNVKSGKSNFSNVSALAVPTQIYDSSGNVLSKGTAYIPKSVISGNYDAGMTAQQLIKKQPTTSNKIGTFLRGIFK